MWRHAYVEVLNMTPKDDEKFLRENMPVDPIMQAAWIGSVRYALGQADIIAAFRKDTGEMWEIANSSIECMIDEATGADRDFLRKFVIWHNENLWGLKDGKPIG
jgi:hypothetical protein